MTNTGFNFLQMLALANGGPAALGSTSTPSAPPPPSNEGGGPPTTPGGDLKASHRKGKKKRGRFEAVEGTIQLSEEDSDHTQMSRPGKEPLVRSPKLNLENLYVADYDRYMEDPLEAASDVCKAASNLMKKFKREEEKRFAELKKEMDHAVAKSKEASEVLKKAERKIETLTSSTEKVKKDANDKVATTNQKVQKLEGSISKLKGDVKSLESVVSEAVKAKEMAEATIQTVTNDAVRVPREQFKNALE